MVVFFKRSGLVSKRDVLKGSVWGRAYCEDAGGAWICFQGWMEIDSMEAVLIMDFSVGSY